MKEKIPEIDHVKHEDAPEGWFDRCSGDGYETSLKEDGGRVFNDNGVSVDIGFRPCAKCNCYPNERGDDACIANLGNVMNACCGHGNIKGYIQFDNGITIRGNFEIEYSEDFKPK